MTSTDMAPKTPNFSYTTPIFSAEDLAATKIVYVIRLGFPVFLNTGALNAGVGADTLHNGIPWISGEQARPQIAGLAE